MLIAITIGVGVFAFLLGMDYAARNTRRILRSDVERLSSMRSEDFIHDDKYRGHPLWILHSRCAFLLRSIKQLERELKERP